MYTSVLHNDYETHGIVDSRAYAGPSASHRLWNMHTFMQHLTCKPKCFTMFEIQTRDCETHDMYAPMQHLTCRLQCFTMTNILEHLHEDSSPFNDRASNKCKKLSTSTVSHMT